MEEKNFKWMMYALLFLILHYVSKEGVYMWLSCIMCGIGLLTDIIEVISRHKNYKGK